jgi:hypothetical protein
MLWRPPWRRQNWMTFKKNGTHSGSPWLETRNSISKCIWTCLNRLNLARTS